MIGPANSIIEDIDARLARGQSSFASFFSLAQAGDANAVYRGRPVWAKHKAEDIVKPVQEIMAEFPTARGAALYLISNLVHENVHHFFLEKERREAPSSKSIDYSDLELAIRSLIAKLSEMQQGLGPKSSFPIILLNWLFELSAELCRLNHNRPIFNHQRPLPNSFLRTLQQVPCIADLLSLLQSTFTLLLQNVPEKAIMCFVTAHKTFFNNFDWVTLHIVDSFPSNMMNQLLIIGAKEFERFYNDTIILSQQNQKRMAQPPDDYSMRLQLFSDIFQYMEKNRKIELRSCVLSTFQQYLYFGDNVEAFIFLLKLSFVSPDIVLPFSDELFQIVLNPRSFKNLSALKSNAFFNFAISSPSFLQNFMNKMLEKANTKSLFQIIETISPLIRDGNG